MWDRTNLNAHVLYQGAAFSRAEKRLETTAGFSPCEMSSPPLR
jgi:hypothetical protein